MGDTEPLLARLQQIESNFNALTLRMGDPEVAGDPREYQKLAKRHKELTPVVAAFRDYKNLLTELDEYREVLQDASIDGELRAMARSESERLREELEQAQFNMQRLLLPRDPMDEKNVVLEIRAGTGGEEAALFAAEMFRAYCRYAETRHWKVGLTQMNETGLGGVKEVTAMIEGRAVYSRLKYESGTHRVQRVPQTEAQGRVHTSAITVAVLPEAEEVDVQIDEKDLRIDRYRSSGAGGQHVNTTDSAVRITHLPTQIVVTCQDEKSQIKNREKAMRVLRSHLLELKFQQQQSQIAAQRRSQVGSGDRSEKIRTYNFPQSRVTDHRIKFTMHRLEAFMNGEMDELMDACATRFEAQRIEREFASNAANA